MRALMRVVVFKHHLINTGYTCKCHAACNGARCQTHGKQIHFAIIVMRALIRVVVFKHHLINTGYTCKCHASYNGARCQTHGKQIHSANIVMRAFIRVVVFNATLSTLDIRVSVMLVTMVHVVKHMVSRYVLQTQL